jgi:hypothetical protein
VVSTRKVSRLILKSEVGVILSEAAFQAERRILRTALITGHARFLAPLVRTRGFGMTPLRCKFKLGHHFRSVNHATGKPIAMMNLHAKGLNLQIPAICWT